MLEQPWAGLLAQHDHHVAQHGADGKEALGGGADVVEAHLRVRVRSIGWWVVCGSFGGAGVMPVWWGGCWRAICMDALQPSPSLLCHELCVELMAALAGNAHEDCFPFIGLPTASLTEMTEMTPCPPPPHTANAHHPAVSFAR